MVPEKPKRPRIFKTLSEFEYEILCDFRDGKALSIEQVDEIIKLMVNSPAAQTKGFVVDLTFQKNAMDIQWGTRLIESEILVGENQLTHIIELLCDDEEVKRRAEGLLITP